MPRYIALLRAINVGGHTVKMDRLRALFEELNLTHVETFIASGNVIFDTRSTQPAALETKITRHLSTALGYPVDTFLRTPAELEAIAAHQPFAPEDHAHPDYYLYVLFLAQAPSPAAARQVVALSDSINDLAVLGRELYWLRRAKISDAAHPAPPFDKVLSTPGTLRNVTTVRKLAAKYPASPKKP